MARAAGNDSSEHDLIDELADEFLSRKLAGELPTISEYCQRYPDLQDQIRDLFPTLDLLEDVKPEISQSMARSSPHPETISQYRIVRQIGQGGMGVVYEAEHRSLGRRVALKVVSSRMSRDAQTRARFEREGRAVAKLHHTNIVPLFEVGDDDGHLFLAMQLIPGKSLDHVITELREGDSDVWAMWSDGLRHREASDSSQVQRGSFDSRGSSRSGNTAISNTNRQDRFRWIAQIGLQAAEAIAYAHQRGVIHRDIKPSNLLLDDSGVVWLTDFGLATSGDDELTRTGDFLGTLRYMAPERFQNQCDERADVYGLGLALYELLTLKPAFSSSDRLELMSQIRQSELPRIQSLNPQTPRDLETIVLKACDGDPAARYQSAQKMAEDLRCFIADEPIQARRTSLWEKTVRWARRNQALAGAFATITALLVLLLTVSTSAFFREARIRNAAETNNQRLRQRLYSYQVQRAASAYRDEGLAAMQKHLNECPEDLRGWEWYRCASLAEPKQLLTISGFERPLFTPDGQFIITAGHRGSPEANAAKVWDANTGQPVGPSMAGRGNLTSLALPHNGKRLVTGFENGDVVMWDFDTRQQLWSKQAHSDKIDGIAFSPDGTRVASVSWDQTLKIFASDTGDTLLTIGPTGYRLRCVEFSPVGNRIASACYDAGTDAAAHVWDCVTGELLLSLQGHADSTETLAYSPDGQQLITGSSDNTIKLWDATSGAVLKTFYGHEGVVQSVVYSPDGNWIASGSADRTIRTWNLATGREVTRYRTIGPVPWLSFSHDGRKIASFGGRQVDVWDLFASPDVVLLRHGKTVTDCDFAPVGRQMASCGDDGAIKIWDVTTGQLVRVLLGHEARINRLAWHPTNGMIASASNDQTARLWNAESGRPVASLALPGKRVMFVAFSPDGTQLACSTDQMSVSVYDVESRDPSRELFAKTEISSLTWSPDGRCIITGDGSGQGNTLIWDVASGKVVKALSVGGFGIAFNPRNNELLACTDNGTAMICDSSGEITRLELLGVGRFPATAFSPDGRRLAIGGYFSGATKIWDSAFGDELLKLSAHTSGVRAVSFSSDGTMIASAHSDGMIAIWESDRPPAAARTRAIVRTASEVVDRLFDTHTFARDVVDALEKDDRLPPDVKALAKEIAEIRGDDVFQQFSTSWSVTTSGDSDRATYEMARRKAASACARVPDSPAFRTALGIAEYRLGHYQDALGHLRRARGDALFSDPPQYSAVIGEVQKAIYPVHSAFLAMTLYQLGRHADAQMEFDQLQTTMRNLEWDHFPDATRVRREAEALIAGGK